ncbi:exodeoxyribonuclease V subunit gamma [Nocardia sp. CNY236]|uniref:exodeoxyribonuclease V subunit gamma n=1 Tax=Nocardia sp. CNY236 TaxID=1169152 RepID=UPI00041F6A8E|nr:exodeoxyribonuclease V subunit gamma [Nocardia sp. CNY236]
MPLHIHRAERADVLAGSLAEMLASPQEDPFAAEVVVVPANGVQRWLTQTLAGVLGAGRAGDGICANVDFLAPAALTSGAVAAVTGMLADDDPWAPQRVVWAMLRVIDAAVSEPWCAVVARHLGTEPGMSEHRLGRRYATAARILSLFDGYGAQRPELLREWTAGHDSDGAGGAVPDDLLWQPRLWRLLRTEVQTPSPAERLDEACARLRAQPDLVELPARLSLFGVSGLSTEQLAVVSALADARDVHVWLVHPSPVLWSRLAGVPTARVRAEDRGAQVVSHPLAAGLARDVREFQHRLTACAVPRSDIHHRATAPDPGHRTAVSDTRMSLLQTVQAAIRDDRWPPVDGEVDADGTVQVHACHGPARQVEVLRECLLGLFAADETLEPRDVLVMCPEVDTYAPLVRAAFVRPATEPTMAHSFTSHPAHRLRVRPADRDLALTNPLLTVISALLELADGRVGVPQVLDVAALETVRRRCGFDDEDLERLREWAAESGARWGIGQRQRQAFGVGDFAQNTFNSALDRILLGVSASEANQDWLDLALPLEDVDSNDIDLAGRFAEFVDRLAVCLRDLRGPRPASEWSSILGRALDLLTDVSDAQQWLRVEAGHELAAATEHAGEVSLRLTDIVELLRARLTARPARADFRTGDLTVCTMAAMRSVPHRVIVILGLDDEVFPRAAGTDGDDVLARRPCTGERDPRSADRHLLLDAILAAREHLLIFHTGADPVSGKACPPAIPLADLLDTVRAHVGAAAMNAVITRHPLQAFDPRNFRAEQPLSYDTVALAGARAAIRPPRRAPAFLAAPLPSVETPPALPLSDLVSFVEHPVRGFLWQRLGLRVPEHESDITDRLPIELDGLATWQLGERLLTARLTGADPAALRAMEWRRGTLPPAGFGAAVLEDVERTVDRLVHAAQPDYAAQARTVDIAADLGNGHRIIGTVPQVRGDTVVHTTFSRLAPKHRLGAWVTLLALAVTEPRPWRAVCTGRGRYGRPAWRCELTAPDAPIAEKLLRELVALREAGLTEPLPITPTASAVYAERRVRGASVEEAVAAAEREFYGGSTVPGPFGDHADRHLRYVWGPTPRLDLLLAAPSVAGEPSERTRFGALACRLWAPLLAMENQGQP